MVIVQFIHAVSQGRLEAFKIRSLAQLESKHALPRIVRVRVLSSRSARVVLSSLAGRVRSINCVARCYSAPDALIW